MPGHYGRSSSSGSRGSPHSGGGGGGWSPGAGGKQHQPKTKAKHSPHGGGPGTGYVPPKKKTTTVTTGGASPFAYTKTPVIQKGRTTTGGITGINSTALLRAVLKARYRPKPRGLSSNVRMTYHGSPYYNAIMNQGFIKGKPTGGFGLKLADLFQSGAKTLSFPSKTTASIYGKTIPIVSSAGNLTLPSGGIPGKTSLEALKNIGKTRFGTEVIHTPAQATKGMELASKLKAGEYPTSATAKRLLQTGTTGTKTLGKTLARLAPGAGAVLGGASALGHIKAGNYGQAAMAGLSMVPGPVGWAGLGGELALGALQNAKQIPNWQATRKYANGGLADLYRYGGFSG